MDRTPWIERKFHFDCPEGWMADVLERLRGTGVRITAITAGMSEEELAYQHQGKWSIKEHIGHLSDLEDLHIGRLEDFILRKETLRPADMTNSKTNAAGHNESGRDALIAGFIKKREALIAGLEKLDDETQRFRSMHPRLKTLMRPVDMAFFTAEHDDHHLASMRELLAAGKQR